MCPKHTTPNEDQSRCVLYDAYLKEKRYFLNTFLFNPKSLHGKTNFNTTITGFYKVTSSNEAVNAYYDRFHQRDFYKNSSNIFLFYISVPNSLPLTLEEIPFQFTRKIGPGLGEEGFVFVYLPYVMSVPHTESIANQSGSVKHGGEVKDVTLLRKLGTKIQKITFYNNSADFSIIYGDGDYCTATTKFYTNITFTCGQHSNQMPVLQRADRISSETIYDVFI